MDKIKSIELTEDSTEIYTLPDGRKVTGAEFLKEIQNLKPGEFLPGFGAPEDD
jgi:hypothetical protein